MEHGAPSEWEKDKNERYNTKLGLIMFAIYTSVYLAFVLISVLSPRSMAVDVGGLNLAVVYGFGLIILGIVQALVYNYMVGKRESKR